MVMHRGRCVPAEECPCIDADGGEYPKDSLMEIDCQSWSVLRFYESEISKILRFYLICY